MARTQNPDYDMAELVFDCCNIALDAGGKAAALDVATAGARAAYKAAQRYAPASVALKSLAWPAALKSTDADGSTDTAGWKERLKQAADPFEQAVDALRAARAAGDTTAIQVALSQLSALVMPANEVAVKLTTALGDHEKARKKERRVDPFEAAFRNAGLNPDQRP